MAQGIITWHRMVDRFTGRERGDLADGARVSDVGATPLDGFAVRYLPDEAP